MKNFICFCSGVTFYRMLLAFLAGSNNRRNATSLIPLLSFIIGPMLYAQTAPAIQWQQSYGGSSDEVYYSLQPTNDHGFLLIGDTRSTDGDVHSPPPSMNSWVVKIDSLGTLKWENAIGGSEGDHSYSGQQDPDGGFIVGVESQSSDGDASENFGGYDFLFTRLNDTGKVILTEDYGGSLHDHPTWIGRTKDGGCIMAGGSDSNDGDIAGHHGSILKFDVWVLKLDSSGNIEWSKSIGGSKSDFGLQVQQLFDGNYIVVGESESNEGDITGHHGDVTNQDLLVMKIDTQGNILWQKLFGGSQDDIGYSLKQTWDGGFIVVGSTGSSDDDVSFNHGGQDFWILKLGTSGDLQWEKTYGGEKSDIGRSIQPALDGGYIAAGETTSDDGDVTGNHGGTDYWVIKIDSTGSLQWQETLGGSASDFGKTIWQLSDKSFIVGGNSFSSDGQVSGHHGTIDHADYWVVKLDSEGTVVDGSTPDPPFGESVHLSIHPSPASDVVTVEISTANNLQGTLELLDVNGKSLMQRAVSYSAGEHKQTIDLSDYSAGTYFVSLESRGKKFTEKIEKR